MKASHRAVKGRISEFKASRWFERQGFWTYSGSPTEPGCDFLVGDGLQVIHAIEVKSGPWSYGMASADRQSAARAGDLWRLRGIRHYVIFDAAKVTSQVIEVGLRDGRAMTLYKHPPIKLHEAGKGLPIGVEGPPRATDSRAERAGGISGRNASEPKVVGGMTASESPPAPAMPEREHQPWCPGDEHAEDYCLRAERADVGGAGQPPPAPAIEEE